MGLVKYLAQRPAVERAIERDKPRLGTLEKRLLQEQQNTVKQAEILYALSFVSTGLASCDQLRYEIAERIMTGLVVGSSGWGVTLNSGAVISELATAHVLRALSANGFPVSASIHEELRGRLLARARSSGGTVDEVYVSTFVLQVLIETSLIQRSEAVLVFDYLWLRLKDKLAEPRESSIDLLGDHDRDFVRVPWQIHLIADAWLVRPIRRYLASSTQAALNQIVSGVLGEGFRYPDSGPYVSTRTYGYIYGMLSIIGSHGNVVGRGDLTWGSTLISALGVVRKRHRVIQGTLWAGAVTVVAAATLIWMRSDDFSIGDLAANFVAGGVIALMAWTTRRLR